MGINAIEVINAFLEIILFASTTSKAFKASIASIALFNTLPAHESAPP